MAGGLKFRTQNREYGDRVAVRCPDCGGMVFPPCRRCQPAAAAAAELAAEDAARAAKKARQVAQ